MYNRVNEYGVGVRNAGVLLESVAAQQGLYVSRKSSVGGEHLKAVTRLFVFIIKDG